MVYIGPPNSKQKGARPSKKDEKNSKDKKNIKSSRRNADSETVRSKQDLLMELTRQAEENSKILQREKYALQELETASRRDIRRYNNLDAKRTIVHPSQVPGLTHAPARSTKPSHQKRKPHNLNIPHEPHHKAPPEPLSPSPFDDFEAPFSPSMGDTFCSPTLRLPGQIISIPDDAAANLGEDPAYAANTHNHPTWAGQPSPGQQQQYEYTQNARGFQHPQHDQNQFNPYGRWRADPAPQFNQALSYEEEERLAKEAKQAEYRAQLEEQIRQKQAVKAMEKADRRRAEARVEAELAAYAPPWDPVSRASRPGGGGEPLKDVNGNAMADLRGGKARTSNQHPLAPPLIENSPPSLSTNPKHLAVHVSNPNGLPDDSRHHPSYATSTTGNPQAAARRSYPQAQGSYDEPDVAGYIHQSTVRNSHQQVPQTHPRSSYEVVDGNVLRPSAVRISHQQVDVSPTGGGGGRRFMSAMAELTPGPSEEQRRHADMQRQQLLRDLEEQIRQKREREAQQRAQDQDNTAPTFRNSQQVSRISQENPGMAPQHASAVAVQPDVYEHTVVGKRKGRKVIDAPWLDQIPQSSAPQHGRRATQTGKEPPAPSNSTSMVAPVPIPDLSPTLPPDSFHSWDRHHHAHDRTDRARTHSSATTSYDPSSHHPPSRIPGPPNHANTLSQTQNNNHNQSNSHSHSKTQQQQQQQQGASYSHGHHTVATNASNGRLPKEATLKGHGQGVSAASSLQDMLQQLQSEQSRIKGEFARQAATMDQLQHSTVTAHAAHEQAWQELQAVKSFLAVTSEGDSPMRGSSMDGGRHQLDPGSRDALDQFIEVKSHLLPTTINTIPDNLDTDGGWWDHHTAPGLLIGSEQDSLSHHMQKSHARYGTLHSTGAYEGEYERGGDDRNDRNLMDFRRYGGEGARCSPGGQLRARSQLLPVRTMTRVQRGFESDREEGGMAPRPTGSPGIIRGDHLPSPKKAGGRKQMSRRARGVAAPVQPRNVAQREGRK